MKVNFQNIISFLFIFTLVEGSAINLIFSFIDRTQNTINLNIPQASTQETEVINETMHEVVGTEPSKIRISSLLTELVNKRKFKTTIIYYSCFHPSVPLPPPEQLA